MLRAEPDLTRAAQRLIERALDAGGPDNITAVLVRIGEGPTVSAVGAALIDEAAEKARTAYMRAQALTRAAERSFAAILRVRDGGRRHVADLKTAAVALGTTCKDVEAALREARESADRAPRCARRGCGSAGGRGGGETEMRRAITASPRRHSWIPGASVVE